MYNNTAEQVQMPTDKTRRKRLKVVSACSECRRKKTKCSGEKPCAGCIKTHMDCNYSSSPKTTTSHKPAMNRPITTHHPIEPPAAENNSIHVIEARLGVIEDILKILLSGTNTEPRNSAFSQHSVGPYYGEIYSRKRRYRQDVIQLPPPINYQPSLSESSSTSTTSSISSTTSPKINTIQTLLNDDTAYRKPSAFYRPVSVVNQSF